MSNYTNPNTRKVWTFPRDAKKYAAIVERTFNPEPCEHGHFGCAIWYGGPCVDEQLQNISTTDET